jgi:plastocyanin
VAGWEAIRTGYHLLAGFAKRGFLLPLVILLLLISSLVSSQERDKGVPLVIHMTDEMKFIPDRLTIQVGHSVEWINDAQVGGASHTVTTDPEKAMDPKHVSSPRGAEVFDSGNIKPGKSFTYVFNVPGSYKYVCAPHESTMRGEITVEP